MAATDDDIERIARLLIARHGDAAAVARARRSVVEARRNRDQGKGDFWLRVVVALGTLGTPPAVARN